MGDLSRHEKLERVLGAGVATEIDETLVDDFRPRLRLGVSPVVSVSRAARSPSAILRSAAWPAQAGFQSRERKVTSAGGLAFKLRGVNWIMESADSFARWQKQVSICRGLLRPNR